MKASGPSVPELVKVSSFVVSFVDFICYVSPWIHKKGAWITLTVEAEIEIEAGSNIMLIKVLQPVLGTQETPTLGAPSLCCACSTAYRCA